MFDSDTDADGEPREIKSKVKSKRSKVKSVGVVGNRGRDRVSGSKRESVGKGEPVLPLG